MFLIENLFKIFVIQLNEENKQIVINRNLYLILANGEINGIGFWLIDKTYNEFPMIENKELLECHRKEIIGEESASNILFAINFNLNNLMNDLKKEGYDIEKPPKGISFNLPLNVLEDIFDFWLETYKNKATWQTSIGLLKIKKRVSLTYIIKSKAIKNRVKDLACIIEKLHNYRPSSTQNYKNNDPMWK
tara:strand:- start:640 stop:1209 length:570 start_codon:yes stop_codon:yes gene_type:complete